MSSDNGQKKEFYDLQKSEVETYFEKAQKALSRTDIIMSDHYNGVKVLGPEVLQRVAEMHAIAGAFHGYLEKAFVNYQAVPEDAIFRVRMVVIGSIIKMVLGILESKQYLSQNNISLEDH